MITYTTSPNLSTVHPSGNDILWKMTSSYTGSDTRVEIIIREANFGGVWVRSADADGLFQFNASRYADQTLFTTPIQDLTFGTSVANDANAKGIFDFTFYEKRYQVDGSITEEAGTTYSLTIAKGSKSFTPLVSPS
jgi:hypothetical protein